MDNIYKIKQITRLMLLTGFLSLSLNRLVAQVPVVNQSERVFIGVDEVLYIKGSYLNETTFPILNEGTIIVSDSIVNRNSNTFLFESANADKLPVTGLVKLQGTGIQKIGGYPINFYNLLLDNGQSELRLGGHVGVNGSLTISIGDIFLNGYNLDFGLRGALLGETNENRIYGSSGFLIARENALSASFNRIGLEFQVSGNLGTTIVKRGHEEQDGAGSGSIFRYYTINPSQAAPIHSIKIPYWEEELNNMSASSLGMYISTNNGLVWKHKGGVMFVGDRYLQATDSAIQLAQQNILTLSKQICDELPQVNIGNGTVYLCQGDSVILDAKNAGNFFEWSTGAKTQAITVKTTGTYHVAVTNVNGCIGYDTVGVEIKPFPEVDFVYDMVCVGATTTFTNKTSISSGSVSYSWDFGDPLTLKDSSNLEHPSWKYAAAGIYEVRLKVTSDFGCVKTIKKNISVHPLPKPSFTVSNTCVNTEAVFSNTSKVITGYANTYSWNFGDGNTSTEVDPTHIYTAPGTYSVSLTANTNAGCTDVFNHSITIYNGVTAAFSFNEACPGGKVIFKNESLSDDAISYHWKFGDGTTSTLSSPEKVYAASGEYTVVLKTTTSEGCTDENSKIVKINQVPEPSFNVDGACAGNAITLSNTTTSEGNLSYSWSFGDGTSSTDINPVKIYTTAGTYTLAMTATSDAGCTKMISKNVEVHPVPVANFSFVQACSGKPTYFANKSSVSQGSMLYQWEFGDGNSSTEPNPVHTYTAAGTYTVSMKAVTSQGCENLKSYLVEAYEFPLVDFGGTISSCGSSYTLDALNAGAEYLWSTNETSQKITVKKSGSYSVTITNQNNCSFTESVQVKLLDEVKPNIGSDRQVCETTTLDAGYPGATYKWSTGETSRSIVVNQSGTYSVQVIDNNNCSGSASVAITVSPKPAFDLGNDRLACAGESVNLDAGIAASSYLWSTGATTRSINVTTGGTYAVTVTNAAGCSATDQLMVGYSAPPLVNLGEDREGCGQMQLDANVLSDSYLWSTGETTRIINVSSSGKYSVKAMKGSCEGTDEVEIVIRPALPLDLGPDITICNGDQKIISAGVTASQYKWSTGAVSPEITVGASGTYWLEVTNESGCVSRDELQLKVERPYNIALGDDMLLCDVSGTVLDAGVQAVEYNWSSSNGFSSSEKSIIVPQAGKYWVSARNATGCIASDTILMQAVSQPLQASFLNSSLLNEGDTVQFINLSFPSPYKVNWDFGDGVVSTEQHPDHAYLSEGEYKVMLRVQNEHCTDTLSKIVQVKKLRQSANSAGIKIKMIEVVKLKAYPVPTVDKLNIELELTESSKVQMQLISLSGVVLQSYEMEGKEILKTLDISGLSAGMYALQVSVGKQRIVKKVIKH